jgi:hypothetical protein
MASVLSGNTSGPRGSDRLIARDPTGLNTLTIPLRAGQGRLQRVTFLTSDGYRSLAPSQINGVLSLDIDSDQCPDGYAVAVYSKGRFLWRQICIANPVLVPLMDALAITSLAARQLTFEAVASGALSWPWISLPA